MFDIRFKEDIVRDIEQLNEMCKEWTTYKNMISACIKQTNIKDIVACNCQKENLEARLKCKECRGTGYVLVFEAQEASNE